MVVNLTNMYNIIMMKQSCDDVRHSKHEVLIQQVEQEVTFMVVVIQVQYCLKQLLKLNMMEATR